MGLEEGRDWEEKGKEEEEEEDFPLELAGLSLSSQKFFSHLSGFCHEVLRVACAGCVCIHIQSVHVCKSQLSNRPVGAQLTVLSSLFYSAGSRHIILQPAALLAPLN